MAKTREKNPTAVLIGQRIKQARLMAGFETLAKLNEQLPQDWSDSRIGNYEAGISIPSPDDLMIICKITHASPCWLMFGIGPIRASQRDIQAIRHQNLVFIFEQVQSSPTQRRALLKAIGLSAKKLDEHINNPFFAISDRLARHCEKFQNKPTGWMDEQHVENDPLCQSFPEDMRELMFIYSELDEGSRGKLLRIARVLSEGPSPG